MSLREVTRWKEWAERLRQEMMRDLTPQVTKSVDLMIEEIGTDKSTTTLHSRRYWLSCQAGKQPNDTLVKAGFDIEFEPTDKNQIESVTLRLNSTWAAIMQRVVDRTPDRLRTKTA